MDINTPSSHRDSQTSPSTFVDRLKKSGAPALAMLLLILNERYQQVYTSEDVSKIVGEDPVEEKEPPPLHRVTPFPNIGEEVELALDRLLIKLQIEEFEAEREREAPQSYSSLLGDDFAHR